ncbi:heterokaryon incompatibility protein-domain-containing protein [Bisporella sp. PMI_857]|nr:heterokaryon incompatibility protein-domain-containing protein [Bisporella sp. PMI_857]
MRLLQLGPGDELTLTEDLKCDLPPYAILSHTWGGEDDEVNFQEIIEKTGKNKPGYQKVVFCGKQARTDRLYYFWVDTCCIDKARCAELHESIISMFAWYQGAKICYVYLADISRDECDSSEISRATWLPAFRRSKWFARGWTLQELLAPASVRFFDQYGSPLGDKAFLKQQVCDITGIAETALLGAPLANFKVSERYEWARSRQTTREEDWAYSLQGIFGVIFTPNYGEGRANAVRRLVNATKEALLNVEMQSFIIDAVGHRQVISPLLLDIAFLETLSLFDEAKAQAEHMVSTFFAFLRRLLWSIPFPIRALRKLEKELDMNCGTLRGVIASEKKIALDLQQNEENGQETLKKLKTAQDFIEGQMRVSTYKVDAQARTLEEIEILKQYIEHTKLEVKDVEDEQQQDEEYAKLKEQVPKLFEECRQLRQTLELTIDQLIAQRTETDNKVSKLEAKQEEAERIRREWESKTVWQKIGAWIDWLLSLWI